MKEERNKELSNDNHLSAHNYDMQAQRAILTTQYFAAAIAFLLSLCLSGCSLLVGTPIADAAPPVQGESLRNLAAQRGVLIGAAVDMKPFRQDPVYRQVLAREFNVLMPENAMKFAPLHPERDRYNFTNTDALIDFAIEHKIQVRGHPLVWHYSLPQWLENGTFTRDELIEILHDHINKVVSRYRGKILAWDVINEVLSRDGSYESNLWLRGIGPEYIDLSLQWAREADPNAKLFYNEYSAEELGQKADAVYHLVKSLKQRGVPIDGVGFQMHKDVTWDGIEDVVKNMQRLSALGLEVSITEMDVFIPENLRDRQKALRQQGKLYQKAMQGCLQVPTCTALVTWGFSDRYTWANAWRGSGGDPLIFDNGFRPKPSYYGLQTALMAGK